ncbi:MAG TPA: hypothetical protein VFE47_15010 [Tepidisphaeraceae bacterium]|jgi:hypothetical protein|nr:hypothetical protein [Tepidisphaeraceae bacterium]
MNAKHLRPGFTLTDLCVAFGIALVVLALLPAIVNRAVVGASKSQCSLNLKNIAVALITYANTNNNQYPRTIYDPDHTATAVFSGINAPDPFKPGGPKANDVSAAMYLLLRESGMTPAIFVCPSSPGDQYEPQGNETVKSKSNFPSPQNLSYSLNNPYPSAKAVADGWKWNGSLGTDYALAADLNPGSAALATVTPAASTATMQSVNSPNHGYRGQNVLYGDYHVAWQPSPFCGEPRPMPGGPQDNIYTSQTAPPSVGGTPQDAHDSVLLPMATDGFRGHGPVDRTPEGKWGRNVIVGGLILLTIILSVLLLQWRDRSQKRA